MLGPFEKPARGNPVITPSSARTISLVMAPATSASLIFGSAPGLMMYWASSATLIPGARFLPLESPNHILVEQETFVYGRYDTSDFLIETLPRPEFRMVACDEPSAEARRQRQRENPPGNGVGEIEAFGAECGW